MITDAQLIQICQMPEARAAVWYMPLSAAMEEFEINTPYRIAHFLAQISHESGGFRYVKEIWTNSPAQQSYEMAARRLGNVDQGDGEKFMGRCPVQITGRRNYQRLSEALGMDFVAQPALLERVDYGSRAAGWFWKVGAGLNLGNAALDALKQYGMGAGVNLNDLADLDDIKTITLCINGGLNGFEQRSEILLRVFNVLGVCAPIQQTATWEKV